MEKLALSCLSNVCHLVLVFGKTPPKSLFHNLTSNFLLPGRVPPSGHDRSLAQAPVSTQQGAGGAARARRDGAPAARRRRRVDHARGETRGDFISVPYHILPKSGVTSTEQFASFNQR